MAHVGSAYLNVVPKMDGLGASVQRALGGAGAPAGRSLAAGVAKGFGLGSAAVMGAASSVASKAIDSIGASMGKAISRFDTLSNYPVVMQNLGYAADQSEASIARISDRLSTLPTTLDAMVSSVQMLAPASAGIDAATDRALAINDALLAGGVAASIQESAQVQLTKAITTGKMEMDGWMSIQQAMPGQLDQLAKAMLGPEANASRLYKALQGDAKHGKAAEITMQEFADALVRLDKEGAPGIASLQQQAEVACGGVETSMSNMRNAIVKGVAGVMDDVGQERIAGVINDVKAGINDAFAVIKPAVKDVLPEVKSVYGATKDVLGNVSVFAGEVAAEALPKAQEAYVSLKGFAGDAYAAVRDLAKNAIPAAGSLVGTLSDVAPQAALAVAGVMGLKATYGVAEGLVSKVGSVSAMLSRLSPASLGVTAAIAGIGLVAASIYGAWDRQQKLEKSTKGLADTLKDAAALDSYAGKVETIGEKSKTTALTVDQMLSSVADRADRMAKTTSDAQEQIATLNSAQSVIEQYIGQTDLTTEAEGRLQWALKTVNDEFGLTLTKEDVVNGFYKDAEGNVRNLRESIDELVEAKKREVRINALSSNLEDAYAARDDAASALVGEKRKQAAAKKAYDDAEAAGSSPEVLDQLDQALAKANEGLEASRATYESTTEAVAGCEEQLGLVSAATSEAASEYDKWAAGVGPLFLETMSQSGESMVDLADDLEALGVSTEWLKGKSEEELLGIAEAYDGSAESIVAALEKAGCELDDATKASAKNTRKMADDMRSFGKDAKGALDGVDIDVLARRLNEAGVKSDALASIGEEGFARLARACNGNIDAMVWAIRRYNDNPVVDQDGRITIDGAQLVDAQGRVWTWNGTDLVDQDGNVAVDQQQLIDAQGNIRVWNDGSKTFLEPKSTSVSVNTRSLELAMAKVRAWNLMNVKNLSYASNGIKGGQLTGSVPLRKNAAGGIRLHAGGGVIATRATPLDIVGEAGAEAIVPLTNRRYSQPFADVISEGVAERVGGSRQVVNVYLDGMRVNDDEQIRSAMLGLVGELKRKAAM